MSLKATLADSISDWENKEGMAKGYTRRLGNQLTKREGQKFDNGLTLTRSGDLQQILGNVGEFLFVKNKLHRILWDKKHIPSIEHPPFIPLSVTTE